jgi:hypothetical protein
MPPFGGLYECASDRQYRKGLSLIIPPSILVRADEVLIEVESKANEAFREALDQAFTINLTHHR